MSELSASGAGEDKMSLIKQLRCFVVGCNNEYSSSHLLPTSKQLNTQKVNVTFVLKGMRLPCLRPLPKCVYVHVNHSGSNFIYRRSEYRV